MKTRTEQVLTAIHILAWVTFIGLLVKTGAIAFSFAVSLFNPEASQNLYQGLSMSDLRQFNFWHYTLTAAFIFAFSGLKAYIAYLLIVISQKINVSRPFNVPMSLLINKISHVAIRAGIVALAADIHTNWLIDKGIGPHQNWQSGEFLFFAGVIFVIAQIFKKGVEIQSENELTI